MAKLVTFSNVYVSKDMLIMKNKYITLKILKWLLKWKIENIDEIGSFIIDGIV